MATIYGRDAPAALVSRYTSAATWWRISRILHAALWLAVIAYFFYFWIDQKDHFNQLGQLRHSTEFFMFGLAMAAVCMGFFQMAMRDRARVPRHPAPIVPQLGSEAQPITLQRAA
jgi:hypothetical protein